MKAEDVKVGMVVYDKQTDEYFKIGKLQDWALKKDKDLLRSIRPLTKKEKGL